MKTVSFSTYFFRVVFFAFILFYIIDLDNTEFLCKVLGIVNSLIVVNELFSDDDVPYSLHKVVNLFLLIFFILANMMQGSLNCIVTSLPIAYTKSDYTNFQFLSLIFIGIYNFVYNSIRIKTSQYADNTMVDSYPKIKLCILLAIIGFVATVFYYRSNIILMFVRGVEDGDGGGFYKNQTLNLLFNKTLRCMPFSCMLYALLKGGFSKKQLMLLFVLMLFSVFPSSLARSAVAMYWLPIAIISFPLLRKKNVFSLFMFSAFFLIFPFLDIFRRFNDNISYKVAGFDFLNTMNFDASQEFMAVMKWDIVTYGKQLLGAILFFVPRSFWPDKAVGSGYMIAHEHGVFGNISMPWWGEGYINFGYIGVVAFSILLAYFNKKFDSLYWRKKHRGEELTVFDGYYLILLGSILFILRGDLLSSFSYTVGTISSYFFVVKLCQKNGKE